MDGGCIIHNLGSGTGYSVPNSNIAEARDGETCAELRIAQVSEVLDMLKAFEASLFSRDTVDKAVASSVIVKHHNAVFGSNAKLQKEASGKKIAYKAGKLGIGCS